MSLLEYNITRKRRIDKQTSKLEFDKDGNGKKYIVKRICDNVISATKSKAYLPGFHYLVLLKSYYKKKLKRLR